MYLFTPIVKIVYFLIFSIFIIAFSILIAYYLQIVKYWSTRTTTSIRVKKKIKTKYFYI